MLDSELGLVYYNWRYYDALVGCWTVMDRMTEQLCLNTYEYISNQSIHEVDILGMMKSITSTKDLVFEDAKVNIPYDEYTSEYFEDKYDIRNDSFLHKRCTRSSYAAPYFNTHIGEVHKVAQSLKDKHDAQKRRCFVVHVYSKVLSEKGFKELPLPGYDIAYLISHSSYIDDKVFECSLNSSIKRRCAYSNKRLKVFGCHLSGYPGGEILQTETLKKLARALSDLHKIKDCPKISKIQVVSAMM